MGNDNSRHTPESLKGAWFCDCLKFEITDADHNSGIVSVWEQKSMLVNQWTFKYQMPIKDIGKGLSFAGYVLKKSDIPRKRGPDTALVWSHWYNNTTVRWTRRYVRQARFVEECQELHRFLAARGLLEVYETLRGLGFAGRIDKLASISDATLAEHFTAEQLWDWRQVFPQTASNLWIEDKEEEEPEEPELWSMPSAIIRSEFTVACDQLLHNLSRLPSVRIQPLCQENSVLRTLLSFYADPTMEELKDFFTLPNGDRDSATVFALLERLAEEVFTENAPSSPISFRSCASSMQANFDPDIMLDDMWDLEQAQDDLLTDLWLSSNLLSVSERSLPCSPLNRSSNIVAVNMGNHTDL